MRIKQWNQDINLSFLGGYILLSMALIAIDCRNITTIFPDFSLLRIPEFSMFEMMTFHFQTMFLASAMIGYLISKVDTRIMGLSIKYLILKRQIFSLNFVTCFLLLLITGFFAILGFIFSARCFFLNNSPAFRECGKTRIVNAFTTTYYIHLPSEDIELLSATVFKLLNIEKRISAMLRLRCPVKTKT